MNRQIKMSALVPCAVRDRVRRFYVNLDDSGLKKHGFVVYNCAVMVLSVLKLILMDLRLFLML